MYNGRRRRTATQDWCGLPTAFTHTHTLLVLRIVSLCTGCRSCGSSSEVQCTPPLSLTTNTSSTNLCLACAVCNSLSYCASANSTLCGPTLLDHFLETSRCISTILDSGNRAPCLEQVLKCVRRQCAVFVVASDYSKMMEMTNAFGEKIFESIKITLVCGMQSATRTYPSWHSLN